jgi:hypothetical protein
MAGRAETRCHEDAREAVAGPVAVKIEALSQSGDGEENCVQPAPSAAVPTRRPTALALVTAAPSSPVAASRGASRDA